MKTRFLVFFFSIFVMGSSGFAADALVGFTAAQYSADENTPLGFAIIRVRRSGDINKNIQVGYGVIGETARNGEDFTAVSGTFRWNFGDATDRVIQVPIINDNNNERDETARVVLENSIGARIIGTNPALLVIVDDDNAGAEFPQDRYEIDENASPGLVRFLVQRTGALNRSVTIDYQTLDGTATAGEDYLGVTGSLTWAAGDTALKAIDVLVVNDNEREGTESFQVQLSLPGGGDLIGRSLASLTIYDDDDREIQFNALAYTVQEDIPSGELTLEVHRLGAPRGEVQARFQTQEDTAEDGSDFLSVTQTLTWADGNSAPQQIQIPILADTDTEGDERFHLFLDQIQGATVTGTNPATVTILDDEQTVRFLSSETQVNEDDPSGVIRIPVERLGGFGQAAQVQYNVTALTASAGVDFVGGPGVVQWEANQGGVKEIQIQILDDGLVESNETFQISLLNPSPRLRLGSPSQITVTIFDNEVANPGLIRLPGNLSFREDDLTAVLAISRTSGQDGNVSVVYEFTSGTAQEGEDFRGESRTLSWANGESSEKVIRIPLINDDVPENDETFFLQIRNPGGGASIQGSDSLQVTIISEDVPDIQVPQSLSVRAGQTFELKAVPAVSVSRLQVEWEQVSGPLSFLIESPRLLATRARVDDQNVYIFQIKAGVGFGFSKAQSITVTSHGGPALIPDVPSKNIFNPTIGEVAELRGVLAHHGLLQIVIYDRFGREIVELVNQDQLEGSYVVEWSGRDADNDLVAAGVYHALLREAGHKRRLKIVVLK